MTPKQKVLQAIQSDNLTIGQIHDCTGIDKGSIEVILLELKRAGQAALAVDKTWRGFVRGRDFGGYAK